MSLLQKKAVSVQGGSPAYAALARGKDVPNAARFFFEGICSSSSYKNPTKKVALHLEHPNVQAQLNSVGTLTKMRFLSFRNFFGFFSFYKKKAYISQPFSAKWVNHAIHFLIFKLIKRIFCQDSNCIDSKTVLLFWQNIREKTELGVVSFECCSRVSCNQKQEGGIFFIDENGPHAQRRALAIFSQVFTSKTNFSFFAHPKMFCCSPAFLGTIPSHTVPLA